MTGLAAHALVGHAFGTAAVFDGGTLFHQSDAFFAAAANHFQGSKNTGGAGADDDNVLFHNICFLPVELGVWA